MKKGLGFVRVDIFKIYATVPQMVLTAQLRRRLNYHEQRTQSSGWTASSGTDYSGIVVSYTAKVSTMLLLLCVDLGFNSSVDHDSPAGESR